MKVVILRGVPGSGKSTIAKKYYPGAVVCSADHHFESPNPQGMHLPPTYTFDRSKLPEAHRACMRKFLEATNYRYENTNDLVVVDNTNVKLWEFAGYVQVAHARGYEVEVVRACCDPAVAAARGLHGVSLGKVIEMAARFDRVPQSWGVRETCVDTDPYQEPTT